MPRNSCTHITLKFSLLLVCMLAFLETNALYNEKIQRAQNMEAMERMLREAQSNFSIDDRPIHPLMIKFFQNPMSDLAQPYRLALDLNMAEGTNMFSSSSPPTIKEGWVVCPLSDNGFFKYKYIGRLNNGLHIVVSVENLGGTLTIYTLSAFFISIDWALESSGQPYNRLKMEIYFQTPLDFFDRASIDGNAAHVFYGCDESGCHKNTYRIESAGKLIKLT